MRRLAMWPSATSAKRKRALLPFTPLEKNTKTGAGTSAEVAAATGAMVNRAGVARAEAGATGGAGAARAAEATGIVAAVAAAGAEVGTTANSGAPAFAAVAAAGVKARGGRAPSGLALLPWARQRPTRSGTNTRLGPPSITCRRRSATRAPCSACSWRRESDRATSRNSSPPWARCATYA